MHVEQRGCTGTSELTNAMGEGKLTPYHSAWLCGYATAQQPATFPADDNRCVRPQKLSALAAASLTSHISTPRPGYLHMRTRTRTWHIASDNVPKLRWLGPGPDSEELSSGSSRPPSNSSALGAETSGLNASTLHKGLAVCPTQLPVGCASRRALYQLSWGRQFTQATGLFQSSGPGVPPGWKRKRGLRSKFHLMKSTAKEM